MSGGTKTSSRRPVPRVALSRAEAAESLGVSLRFFEQHVQGELRLVYLGRRRLVPLAELERWVAAHSSRVVGGAGGIG